MKIWPLIIEILMSLMKFITVDCLWWSSNSSINLHAAHPLSVVVHSQILIKVSIFFSLLFVLHDKFFDCSFVSIERSLCHIEHQSTSSRDAKPSSLRASPTQTIATLPSYNKFVVSVFLRPSYPIDG